MVRAAYIYSMWDGSQEDATLSSDDLMEQIADQIMNDGNLSSALRNLFQRGVNDPSGQATAGLREMMERIRQERQAQLQKYDLDSLMDDIRNRLNQVLDTERKGIDGQLNEKLGENAESSEDRDSDMDNFRDLLESRAERSREFLDNLPTSVPGAIQELTKYDFINPDARDQFQDLIDTLSQRTLENTFQNLKQELQEMSKSDMSGINNMLGDLNDMIIDVESNNVFWGFIESENFQFADYDIAYGPSSDWSYPTWPSHLDHIIINNELFLDFQGSEVSTFRVDDYLTGAWNAYENFISDHRPVFMRINLSQFDLGDVNGDGSLDILDVITIVNLVLAEEYNELADVNYDEIINIMDVIIVLNMILD